MTDIDKKREQIQEGFSIHLYNRFELVKEGVKWFVATEQARQYFRQVARSLIAQLHLHDIVIKVDKKPPKNPYVSEDDKLDCHRWIAYGNAKKDMKEAGYVAVEPLIDKG